MVRVSILFLVFSVSAVFADQKRNVLIIYVDDLGYGDTGVYGHPIVKTPNIDALAAEGIRFTQFYAPSALCSPSRAGLLTGRTPYRTGVESWIPDGKEVSLGKNEVTIAEVLKGVGYRTAVIGKWHLNGGLWMENTPQPKDFGFDYQYGLAAWVKNKKAEGQGYGPLYPDNMYRNNVAVGETKSFSADLIAGEAIEWLSSSSEAFFLYLTFSEVHAPVASPAVYTQMYDLFLTEESRSHPLRYYFNWANRPYRGKGEYYANITYLDAQIGRVIAHLKKSGQLDQTLIIFSSDNGPVTMETTEPWELSLAGETGGLRGKKRYLYEGGIRVPGIVRYPGLVEAGSISDVPVTALDIMPTIVEFVGSTMPQDRPIDGLSILPLLKGKSLDRKKPLYWSIPTPDGMEFAIRERDWKMILDRQGQPDALFNLAEDYYEVHDKLKERPEKVKKMKGLFDRYRGDIESDPVKIERELLAAKPE
jgi:arylsulfatase A-like enzyme